MRHFFTPLLIVFLGFTLNAQTGNLHHLTDFLESQELNLRESSERVQKALRISEINSSNQKTLRSSATHQLDSVVILEFSNEMDMLLPDRKEFFQYNDLGLTTEEIIYRWDTDGDQWDALWRYRYTYDNEKRITEVLYYEWNSQGNQWVPDLLDVVTYNADGYVDEVTTFIRNGGGWNNYDRVEFTYIEPGIIGQILEQWWENDQWVNDYLITYDYETDRLWSVTEQFWDDDFEEWENDFRWEMEQDDRGNIIRFSNFEWDDFDEEWLEETRILFSYDQNDNQIEQVSYFLDDEDELSPEFRLASHYDENNFLVSDTNFLWDDFEGEWVSFVLTQYEYDAAGNPVYEGSFIEFIFDWELFSERETTFDPQILMENVNMPFLERFGIFELDLPLFLFDDFSIIYKGEIMVNAPLGYTVIQLLIGPETITEQGIYYYSEVTPTSVIEATAEELKVYPNPVADELIIRGDYPEGTSLSLFDLQGRLIMNKQLNQNQQLFVGNLKPGMYLFRIEGEGMIQHGKIVKQ